MLQTTTFQNCLCGSVFFVVETFYTFGALMIVFLDWPLLVEYSSKLHLYENI